MKRGSPQGSLLGCLLYCISTQLLTAGLSGGGRAVDDGVRYFPQDDFDEGDMRFWESDRNGGWPVTFLYVDDTTSSTPSR